MDKSHRHALGWSGVAMLVAVAATHAPTSVQGRAPNGCASVRPDNPAAAFVPARVTFEQVFFSKARRGTEAYFDAFAALRAIRTEGADPGRFGDDFAEGRWVRDRPIDSLEAFGPGFYPENLPRGRWSSPAESPQGFHLVRVTDVDPARGVDSTEGNDPVASR